MVSKTKKLTMQFNCFTFKKQRSIIKIIYEKRKNKKRKKY